MIITAIAVDSGQIFFCLKKISDENTGQYRITVEPIVVITSQNLNNSIVFHRDVLSMWHTCFPDCCFCVVCDEAVELAQSNLLDNSFQLSKQEMQ